MPVKVTKRPQARAGRQAYDKAARSTVNKGTRLVQREIRKRAGKPKGNFPGYASKGALAREVETRPVKKTGKRYEGKFGFLRAGKSSKYRRIHEFGGIIRPKNKPYLMFRLPDGQWIRTKKVRIRRKNYFRDGANSGYRKLRKTMPEHLRSQVRMRFQ